MDNRSVDLCGRRLENAPIVNQAAAQHGMERTQLTPWLNKALVRTAAPLMPGRWAAWFERVEQTHMAFSGVILRAIATQGTRSDPNP
jgi:hypothetical protein